MEKTRLTNRIKDYVTSNYFSKYRGASDVKIKLEAEYKIKTTSAAVSVILSRLVKTGVLTYKNKDGKKLYKNKK